MFNLIAPLSLFARLRLFGGVLAVSTLCLSAAAGTIRVPQDKSTIQAGMDAAANGDIILVSPGTYYENIDFKGKAITVVSTDGATKTTIDGQNKSPAVTFRNSEGLSSVINGFTIAHGGSPTCDDGGIEAFEASPTILNNNIIDSVCAGIDVGVGNPVIQGNRISATHNISQNGGGNGSGIRLYGADAQVISNIIENNVEGMAATQSGYWAAGIFAYGGKPVILQNIIRGNETGTHATQYQEASAGGGIFGYGTTPIIAGNLIYRNAASSAPAGIGVLYGSFPDERPALIANNTIAFNSVRGTKIDTTLPGSQVEFGGGAYTAMLMVNNIIVGDGTVPLIACANAGYPITPAWSNNDIFHISGGSIGPCDDFKVGSFGNISADPQFVDVAADDYHLLSSSPAIDAGNASILGDLASHSISLDKDLDGGARVANFRSALPQIDMGAYEKAGPQNPSTTQLAIGPGLSVWPLAGSTITVNLSAYSNLGIPTGPVTFYIDNLAFSTTTLDASGKTSTHTPPLRPGLHPIYAVYPGQGVYSPATSVHNLVAVSKYPNTVFTLESSKNPQIVGQPITFTVHARSADPAAGFAVSPITVTADANLIATLTPDAAGNASVLMPYDLAVGSHAVEAKYDGDDEHLSGDARVTQVIIDRYASLTVITTSSASVPVGSPVTFTAKVTGPVDFPTGNVYFEADGTNFAACALVNGTCSVQTSTLSRLVHVIRASYEGDALFAPSSGTLTQEILGHQSTISLASNPTTSFATQTVTLTAHVRDANGTIVPTGTVLFMERTTVLGRIILNGVGDASMDLNSLSAGTHEFYAKYEGDGIFDNSDIVGGQVFIQGIPTAVTISAPAQAFAFEAKTILAHVTAPAAPTQPSTGSLSFTAGILALASAPVNANGISSIAFAQPVGDYPITATYAANGFYAGSSATSPAIHVIADSTNSLLSLSAPTQVQGRAVQFAFKVSADHSAVDPIGRAVLMEGSTTISMVPLDANGRAVFNVSTLSAGTHTLTALYVPGGAGALNFIGSSSNAVTVNITASDFTLISPPTLSLQTEHHATLTLDAESIGDFAGAVYLSCGSLPPHATCFFDHGNTLNLATGGKASLDIVFETSDVRGFKAAVTPLRPSGIQFALLALPFTLFALRKKRLASLLAIAFAAIFLMSSLTGCSGMYPGHTPAGTYTLQFTGTGGNITHTATTTLTVTP